MLNAAGLPTGRTKERAAVHRDGDLHRTLHVWLVKDARSVLLQRRSAGKDLEPGKLDVAVGGHFLAGETLPDALRRAVTSPGGTTERALAVLMADPGWPALVARAVEAATARSRELAS